MGRRGVELRAVGVVERGEVKRVGSFNVRSGVEWGENGRIR